MTDKRVGNAVFGIAPGCLGTAVIVPSDLMVPLPPHLSFEAGATAPTVYCTVHAAFGAELAAMAGKRVGARLSLAFLRHRRLRCRIRHDQL